MPFQPLLRMRDVLLAHWRVAVMLVYVAFASAVILLSPSGDKAIVPAATVLCSGELPGFQPQQK